MPRMLRMRNLFTGDIVFVKDIQQLFFWGYMRVKDLKRLTRMIGFLLNWDFPEGPIRRNLLVELQMRDVLCPFYRRALNMYVYMRKCGRQALC
jgi:hypothetical protein